MVSWLIPKNDHYKGLTIYLHRLKTKQLLSDSKRIWLHLMMSLEKDIWDPLPSEKKKKKAADLQQSQMCFEKSLPLQISSYQVPYHLSHFITQHG